MIRNVLAVVAGYFALMIAVFVLLTAAYFVFGTEHAFEAGTYRTSLAWCVTSLVLGIPAAALGGWVCGRIASSRGAVTALAALVAVLGLVMAVPALSAKPNQSPRPTSVPNLEAMSKAQTPAWVAFSNPVIGVLGVLLGGRRRAVPLPAEPVPETVAR